MSAAEEPVEPMSEEEWAKVREFWIDHLNRHPMAAHHGLPLAKGHTFRALCLAYEKSRSSEERLRAFMVRYLEPALLAHVACSGDHDAPRKYCEGCAAADRVREWVTNLLASPAAKEALGARP